MRFKHTSLCKGIRESGHCCWAICGAGHNKPKGWDAMGAPQSGEFIPGELWRDGTPWKIHSQCSQGGAQPSLLFGCPEPSNPHLCSSPVTEVSPAARDVALGLCLGVEELQHPRSALWDFGVGFSRGGRSEVGRAAGEKQLSPGCDHQLCPSGSLQSEHSMGSQCSWGTAHPTWHPGTISPAGQPSTGTPAGLQSLRVQLGLGKLGADGTRQ